MRPYIPFVGPQLIYHESLRDKYNELKQFFYTDFSIYVRQVNHKPFVLLKYFISKYPHYFEAESIVNRRNPKYSKLVFDINKFPPNVITPMLDDNDVQGQGIRKYFVPTKLTQISMDQVLARLPKMMKYPYLNRVLAKYNPQKDYDDPLYWNYDHQFIVAKRAVLDDEIPYSILTDPRFFDYTEVYQFQPPTDPQMHAFHKLVHNKYHYPYFFTNMHHVETSILHLTNSEIGDLLKVKSHQMLVEEYLQAHDSPCPSPDNSMIQDDSF